MLVAKGLCASLRLQTADKGALSSARRSVDYVSLAWHAYICEPSFQSRRLLIVIGSVLRLSLREKLHPELMRLLAAEVMDV